LTEQTHFGADNGSDNDAEDDIEVLEGQTSKTINKLRERSAQAERLTQ